MGDFYYGDNLDVLRGRAIKDESVDLVYLDPPFNSQRTYNVTHREADGTQSEAQRTAFEDNWTMDAKAQDALSFLTLPGKERWKVPARLSATFELLQNVLGSGSTMLAYLAMMGVRLVELRRVMKPTGSLFLHCDPTASHYLKVVLDSLFGPENFRNEIIWRRTGAHKATKAFGGVHDTLLWFSNGPKPKFSPIKRPYMREHVESRYTADDEGRFKFTSGGNVLSGPGATKGESGAKWKGFDPTKKNRHWAVPGFLTQQMPPAFAKLGVLAKLDALFDAGLIDIVPGQAWPTPVRFLGDDDGDYVGDVWAYQPYTQGTVFGTEGGIDEDVAWLGPTDPERVGYPTQKPVGLLQRILRATTSEGDLVLDPFAGCGTTIHAAETLKRKWIGIDITHLAVSVLRRRMKEQFPKLELKVHGEPADAASAHTLAKNNPHEFQAWIVDKVGGVPLEVGPDPKVAKKGGDRGIDGVLLFRDDTKATRSHRMVISVKATTNVAPEMVRELRGTMVREKATLAALLLLSEPTDGMRKEAKSDGQYKSEFFQPVDKIQILCVADLFADKSLKVPGVVTTHKSTPPAGAEGSSLELPFDRPPPRLAKGKSVPPEQRALGYQIPEPEMLKVAEPTAKKPPRR